MAGLFLAARWVGEALQRYKKRPPSATIKGRPIVFSEQDYTAALLHIYAARGRYLSEMARLAQIPIEHLFYQRSQIDFMTLVDHLKSRFTAWYKEILILEDFSPAEYGDLCREFLLLDEMVQTQIRVPLWTQLRKMGLSLKGKIESGLSADPYELAVFKRLLTFFFFIDRLRPDAGHGVIQEGLMPIARVFFGKDVGALEKEVGEMVLEKEITDELIRKLEEKIRAVQNI